MADARGCVKNLLHHSRYGKAGTTACLVLQCLYDVEISPTCLCPCPCLFCVCTKMLNYLSTMGLQRKSLIWDLTLAKVGTHNASVSNDRSISCPPIFWLRNWLDAHVTCLNMCNQSGGMIVVPPLFCANSITHNTTRYRYMFGKKIFVNNISFTKPTWRHCIIVSCTL